MAVAGVDACPVFVDDELRTVAVELDSVNPTIALRRLLDKGGHQGRDELQTHLWNFYQPRFN